jgi:sirohydrochlorin ferrochelatase
VTVSEADPPRGLESRNTPGAAVAWGGAKAARRADSRSEPILLLAHGSSDPRAAATTRALARAVAAASPGTTVRASFLDHAGPRPVEELVALQRAGSPAVTLVPLLLTSAYHGRVDVPAVVTTARAEGVHIPIEVTRVLGPVGGQVPDLLLAGLDRRLAETRTRFDAVVLAAAGTRDPAALGTVDLAARALGHRLGVPCVPAYASASPPMPGAAVTRLRRGGARRVAMAAYFLAPGRLYDAAVESAYAAGAVAATQPLGAGRELVGLVLDRADAAGSVLAAA